MDFPRKRFIEMVKKYVHFRRVKEIQENVQRMKMETNVNERVLLSMKEMEERMMKVGYFRIISPNVRESELRIPESGKFLLLLESRFRETFACRIWNPGLWNPENNSRNPQSH